MHKVYLIQAGEDGPVKIGVAANVFKRLAQYRTHDPIRLRLVGLIDGDRADEKRLLGRFSEYRLHGEWFRPGPQLVEFIASLPPPPFPPHRHLHLNEHLLQHG